ncbi:hypothetical protein [Geomesophilobacter sediminis]|uniref:Uncharacterized protein n=1 Tax=Geomesophilobacter sediminis TaxID=2798584 RepID=A0A8J7JGM7_9BACT|nr:hypothetical protein [Geomesophilobacter sediminis]MBJ6725994.1 hypothetical protein [Geomesophilobacter sediminis]
MILLVGLGSGLVEGALWGLAAAVNLNAAQRLVGVLTANRAGARDE